MLLQDSGYAIKLIQPGIKGPFTRAMPDAKKNKNIAKNFRGPLSDLKKKK